MSFTLGNYYLYYQESNENINLKCDWLKKYFTVICCWSKQLKSLPKNNTLKAAKINKLLEKGDENILQTQDYGFSEFKTEWFNYWNYILPKTSFWWQNMSQI